MRGWIWGILLTVLALGLIVVAVVVTGIIKIGEAVSNETNATIRAQTEGDQVQFELGYGKDITNLSIFIVQDADGKEIWRLDGIGEQKPSRLVYGVVPEGGKQTVPTGGKPPDIRGKHVKVEASCRFIIPMGAGSQSSYAEFDIPK
jgi:hypothetical protein